MYAAKKSFITKALDNHTSETHVTGVYTYMSSYAMTSYGILSTQEDGGMILSGLRGP